MLLITTTSTLIQAIVISHLDSCPATFTMHPTGPLIFFPILQEVIFLMNIWLYHFLPFNGLPLTLELKLKSNLTWFTKPRRHWPLPLLPDSPHVILRLAFWAPAIGAFFQFLELFWLRPPQRPHLYCLILYTTTNPTLTLCLINSSSSLSLQWYVTPSGKFFITHGCFSTPEDSRSTSQLQKFFDNKYFVTSPLLS